MRLRRGLAGAVAAACLLGRGAAAQGQAPAGALRVAAEEARGAWIRHDPAGVLGQSPRILLQLPGTEPSGALSRAQAAALLGQYLAGAREVEVGVQGAREVQPGVAYAELRRRFEPPGGGGSRLQTVLLSFRWVDGGWVLQELRVVEE